MAVSISNTWCFFFCLFVFCLVSVAYQSCYSNQHIPDRTNPQLSTNGRTGLLAPKLELIGEDDTMETYDLYDPYGDDQSDHGDMDFLEVDLVRSMYGIVTW